MRKSDSLATMPTCTNSEIFRKPESKYSHQSVRIIILNSHEGMRIRKKLEDCELFFSVRIRTGPSDLKNWYPIRKPSENHQNLNRRRVDIVLPLFLLHVNKNVNTHTAALDCTWLFGSPPVFFFLFAT